MNIIDKILIALLLFTSGCYVVSCDRSTAPVVAEHQSDAPSSARRGRSARYRKSRRHARRTHRRKGRWLHKVTLPDSGLLHGKVVHVVDGDTVHVLLDSGRLVNVRVAGINSPECHKRRVRTLDGRWSARCEKDDEGGGVGAYRYMRDLILGKEVSLDCERTKPGSRKCKVGSYGRLLGYIILHGKDINREMVRAGWAFAFTKYPSGKRAQYCRAEFEARAARRGVWKLAPTVSGVMSLMSHKTRRWYEKHDELCRRAMGQASAVKGRK